jgi:dTDP-4-dehydrorhamnose reductase
VNLRTLLLGKSGFLGSYFDRALSNLDAETAQTLEYLSKESLNCPKFTNESDIRSYLEDIEFDLIINCIALANIEKCEEDPVLAGWLNRDVPMVLARQVGFKGKKIVHFSTDAIYSNENQMRVEDSKHLANSVYSRTKLEGEEAVSKNCADWQIYRINFFGNNPRGTSLFNYLISNFRETRPITGFTDNYFNPVFAAELVKIVLKNLDSLETGIYNLGSKEPLSKFDFAKKVAEVFGFDPDLVLADTLRSRNSGNLRTLNLAMDTSKIESHGIVLPSVTNGLNSLRKEMGA